MRRKRTSLIALSVLALLVAWSAWQLLGRGVGLAMAKAHPVAALRWDLGNPEALVRVNEKERDAATKADRARAVLIRRPMDGRAYRQLAEVEAEQGRDEAARTLYRIAARNSPRDRLAQAWLADDALSRGALQEMIDRIDLLLSMDATLKPELLAYLAQLATHADFRAQLVKFLVQGRHWRIDLLTVWTERGTDPASLDLIFHSLLEAGAALSVQERSLWVSRLIKERRWNLAYRTWAGGIPLGRRIEGGGLFNGGFESDPAGEFDWRFSQGSGSRIDTVHTAGAIGNRALRVAFSGRRVDFANVEQTLLLSEGVHSFQIRARLDDIRSDRGLTWRVHCLNDDAILGSGPALTGTLPWHTYSFAFTVPKNCAAQRLRLELPARSSLERMIEGVSWFDDAAIVPLRGLAGEYGHASNEMTALSTPMVPEGLRAPDAIPPRNLGPGRTLQIVRALVNTIPNAAGNLDSDVPVAP